MRKNERSRRVCTEQILQTRRGLSERGPEIGENIHGQAAGDEWDSVIHNYKIRFVSQKKVEEKTAERLQNIWISGVQLAGCGAKTLMDPGPNTFLREPHSAALRGVS